MCLAVFTSSRGRFPIYVWYGKPASYQKQNLRASIVDYLFTINRYYFAEELQQNGERSNGEDKRK